MNNESSSSRTQSCIIVEYSLTRQGEQTFGIRRQTEQVCGRGRGNITLINRLAPTSFLQIFRTEVVILRTFYATPTLFYATPTLFYATPTYILRYSYVHSTLLFPPHSTALQRTFPESYLQHIRQCSVQSYVHTIAEDAFRERI